MKNLLLVGTELLILLKKSLEVLGSKNLWNRFLTWSVKANILPTLLSWVSNTDACSLKKQLRLILIKSKDNVQEDLCNSTYKHVTPFSSPRNSNSMPQPWICFVCFSLQLTEKL